MWLLAIVVGPHKIELTLDGEGGTITSNLHVEETSNANDTLERLTERQAARTWNRAIDGIEALILAHACAGIDVTEKQHSKH